MGTPPYRPITDDDRGSAASQSGFLFLATLAALLQTAILAHRLENPPPSLLDHLPFVYMFRHSETLLTRAAAIFGLSSWFTVALLALAFGCLGSSGTRSAFQFRSGHTKYYSEEGGEGGKGCAVILGMFLFYMTFIGVPWLISDPILALYGFLLFAIPLIASGTFLYLFHLTARTRR